MIILKLTDHLIFIFQSFRSNHIMQIFEKHLKNFIMYSWSIETLTFVTLTEKPLILPRLSLRLLNALTS